MMALVLVPLLATGSVAFLLTSGKLERSSVADTIVEEARTTGEAQALEASVLSEAETRYAGGALGAISRQIPFAATIMRNDLRSAVKTTTYVVATIARMDPGDRAIEAVDRQLLSARATARRPGVSAARTLAAYMAISGRLQWIMERSVTTMASQAAGLNGAEGLVGDIQGLDGVQQLQVEESLVGTQIVQFMGATAKQRTELDGEIIATAALIRSDLAQLSSLTSKALIEDRRSLIDSTATVLLAIADSLATRPVGAPVTVSALADLASASSGMATSSATTERTMVNGIVQASEQLESTAVDTADATVLLVGLLVLVTCGLCYRLYRAIHTPLGALARRAHQITQGELELGDEHGTREIAAVGRALNEAILNLTQLKTQAEALAEGDLEHASLGQATPGPLGQSIYQSVMRVADLQQQLQHQASHDPLTGLLNRRAAIEQLDEALQHAGLQDERIAVMFIDLDGFKQVNDTHGHNVGDDVLRVTAGRLTSTVGASDTVCRIGGDEFIVIVTNPVNLEALQELGRRLVAAIASPMNAGPLNQVEIGASVGISLTDPKVSYSSADLIGEADIAVYQVKGERTGRIHVRHQDVAPAAAILDLTTSGLHAGGRALSHEAGVRAKVKIFDDQMRRNRNAAHDLTEDLRTAIGRDHELYLAYQPSLQVRDALKVNDVTVHGFEALCRWDRPGHGPVLPEEFLAAAERSDLVVELDRWVLDRSCAQLTEWACDPGLRGLTLQVNISGGHLGRGILVSDVLHAISTHSVEPGQLVIELSENSVEDGADLARDELNELRSYGVRVALDDFGTGHTSIARLGRMPIDILKIDRSFMLAAESPGDHREVVGLVVDMAHVMGMTVAAEGVEEKSHYDLQLSLGCDLAQGYYIARPMPPDEIPAWRSDWEDAMTRPVPHTAA